MKLISDSSCDLPSHIIESLDILTIPFSVTFDETKYYRETMDITNSEFYNTLKTTDCFPKTSQPSTQTYIDAFKTYLEKGEDIICICLSSKLSGSYQGAVLAKNTLEEDYKDRKIVIIDSKQASAAQGLLVMKANKLIDEGLDIEYVESILLDFRDKIQLRFTVETLEYLKKGGRIGKAAAIAGGLLKAKPILSLEDGAINSTEKIIGMKKVMEKLVNFAKEGYENDSSKTFVILSGGMEKEANLIKERLESELNIKEECYIFDIGITIGAHLGFSLGVAYCNL